MADQFTMKRIKKSIFSHVDRFSKFPTSEVFDRANADILKFLQGYVLLHGIPRTIRLDQARRQTGR